MVSGAPGTGKSTIARELGAELATVAGLASPVPARRADAAQVLAALIRAREAA